MSLDHIKHIIAVSACKGGVGKSTVAAHLAAELLRRGFNVGLADVDIHGPSIPALFGLKEAQIGMNAQQELIPFDYGGLQIMSFGFLLSDAPAVMRGPMVTRYVQQLLQNTAWGQLDYLIIDMPPGTGDVALTITQQIKLTGAVIVTTPQTLSLLDVSRGILMFEQVNVPVLGVVENMAYFHCPDCGSKHDVFGASGDTLKERFGVETLVRIPLMNQLTREVDVKTGHPFLASAVDHLLESLKRLAPGKTAHPQVKVEEGKIHFTWPDGESVTLASRDLRANCRCARCINEMTGTPILDPTKIRPDISPLKIIPLGNYAVGITWNDGHASGIYPFKLIKDLAASKADRL